MEHQKEAMMAVLMGYLKKRVKAQSRATVMVHLRVAMMALWKVGLGPQRGKTRANWMAQWRGVMKVLLKVGLRVQ